MSEIVVNLKELWNSDSGNGKTDDTVIFQKALDMAKGGTLYVAKAIDCYKVDPLTIPSDTKIVFEEGCILEANSGYRDLKESSDCLLNFKGANNVSIEGNGAVFRMCKNEYTSGEWRHVFNLSFCQNISIDNVVAKDSGGDGFYIESVENLKLTDSIADNCRRNGMSICGAQDALIQNCQFNNSNGTMPQSGIDIEPFLKEQKLKNIVFQDCSASGNKSGGVGLSLEIYNEETGVEPVSVSFNNLRTENNGGAGFWSWWAYSKDGIGGSINLTDYTSIADGTAIHIMESGSNGAAIHINNPTIIDPSAANQFYGGADGIEYHNSNKISGGNCYLNGVAIDSNVVMGSVVNDSLGGQGTNDVLHGLAGDDYLYGDAGDDRLYGDEGNDFLFGGVGNDTLDGGGGNDYFAGGSGDDVYIWGTGKGNDTIDNFVSVGTIENDQLCFVDEQGQALAKKEVGWKRTGDDLTVVALTSRETLTLRGWYKGAEYQVGKFQFGDQEVTTEEVNHTSFILGSNQAEILKAESTGSQLYGFDGNDVLMGGCGDDYLVGGKGNDVYVWSTGGGNDTISNFADYGMKEKDAIVFGTTAEQTNLYQHQVIWNQKGDDLLVTNLVSGEVLKIEDWYKGEEYQVSEFRFSDGVMTAAQINDTKCYWQDNASIIIGEGNCNWIYAGDGDNAVSGGSGSDMISGGDGNDTIQAGKGDDWVYGGNGNDRIDGEDGNDVLFGDYGDDLISGGSGCDVLYGGNGNDTYCWNKGDGNDTIQNWTWNEENGFETVQFGKEINVENLVVKRYDTNMVIYNTVTNENLTILGQFGAENQKVDLFTFANGHALTGEQMEKRTVV